MSDLLIVGAFINSEKSEHMIYEAIRRLSPYFDIALVMHSPASERIQKLVKYFIYDQRNEVMTKEVATVYWGNYPTFDYEIHPNGVRKYYSFAIYRSITNAVKLLSSDYDSFIYLEGDAYFSPEDAIKLRNMKNVAKEQGKKGMFISYGDTLCSTFFFCSMELFKNTFGFYNNSDEYINRCNQIGSHGQLENFLYKSGEYSGTLSDMHVLNGMGGINYFPTSKVGINHTNGKDDSVPIAFTAEAMRLKDTNELAFMYIVHQKTPDAPESFAMKLDGEFITNLTTDIFSTAFKIYPKNEKFLIEIGSNKFYCDTSEILAESNKSFIKLK